MGFYGERVFPYLMDWAVDSPQLAQYRRSTLAYVTGDVLEIGFGTGLNLSYFPVEIGRLVAIEEFYGKGMPKPLGYLY